MAPPRRTLWQIPNVLALDAALIAVTWAAWYAHCLGSQLSSNTLTVLALSVWLTYSADRLLDIRGKRPEQLLSTRHRFSYRHRATLRRLWLAILTLNIAIAYIALEPWHLTNGLYLLSFCLAYTACNQWLSKYFFPKELLVAILFALGVVLFCTPRPDLVIVLHLASVFGLNCLLLSTSERTIDQALQIKSLSTFPRTSLSLCTLGYLTTLPFVYKQSIPLLLTSALSITLLGLLHSQRKHIEQETYRTLADASLLIAPTLALTMWAH